MVWVNVHDFANLDNALRVFRKKVRRAHVLELYGRKSYYISPSEKKHRLKLKKSMT